jgi:hypothetical protein
MARSHSIPRKTLFGTVLLASALALSACAAPNGYYDAYAPGYGYGPGYDYGYPGYDYGYGYDDYGYDPGYYGFDFFDRHDHGRHFDRNFRGEQHAFMSGGDHRGFAGGANRGAFVHGGGGHGSAGGHGR